MKAFIDLQGNSLLLQKIGRLLPGTEYYCDAIIGDGHSYLNHTSSHEYMINDPDYAVYRRWIAIMSGYPGLKKYNWKEEDVFIPNEFDELDEYIYRLKIYECRDIHRSIRKQNTNIYYENSSKVKSDNCLITNYGLELLTQYICRLDKDIVIFFRFPLDVADVSEFQMCINAINKQDKILWCALLETSDLDILKLPKYYEFDLTQIEEKVEDTVFRNGRRIEPLKISLLSKMEIIT